MTKGEAPVSPQAMRLSRSRMKWPDSDVKRVGGWPGRLPKGWRAHSQGCGQHAADHGFPALAPPWGGGSGQPDLPRGRLGLASGAHAMCGEWFRLDDGQGVATSIRAATLPCLPRSCRPCPGVRRTAGSGRACPSSSASILRCGPWIRF